LGGWIGSAFSLSLAFNIAAGCAFLAFVIMLTTKQPYKKLGSGPIVAVAD